MKGLKILFVLIVLGLFTSCEIIEETRFNPDGSGKYTYGVRLDLSDIVAQNNKLEMALLTKKFPFIESFSQEEDNSPKMDTLIYFSDILASQKNGRPLFSKGEREKYKMFEKLSLYMEDNDSQKMYKVDFIYNFDTYKELDSFGGLMKEAEENGFTLLGKAKEIWDYDLNNIYNIDFNRERFILRAKPEVLKNFSRIETEEKENSEDIPTFKIKYIFPYKIKSVSHTDAQIIEEGKGIEIRGLISKIKEEPQYFNTKVEFFN